MNTELRHSPEAEQNKSDLLSPQQEQKKAQAYFDILYPQGHAFLKGALFHLSEKDLRVAAFSLHQAVECFYNTVLLVFTGNKPNTHNLPKLRDYSKHISSDLYSVFEPSTSNEQENNLFDLLERGYTDARYQLDYEITANALTALIEKVINMQAIVGLLCKEKIEQLLEGESISPIN